MTIVPFDDRDGWIWLDGGFVPWREAKVHVLTHALHYASCVFEGERMYDGEIYVGGTVAALGVDALGSYPVAVVGLALMGLSFGATDVMINVEAASVEQAFGRTLMPLFHAFFSLVTVAGAGIVDEWFRPTFAQGEDAEVLDGVPFGTDLLVHVDDVPGLVDLVLAGIHAPDAMPSPGPRRL